jgi:hypothetical protein
MNKFPQEIFVSIENEGQGEDEYKLIHDKAESAAVVDDVIEVGHYVLQNVLNVKSEIKTEVVNQ